MNRIESTTSNSQIEELLYQSGAFQRKPRKLSATTFLRGLLASFLEDTPTLERMAGMFELTSGHPYTKQAVQKRMNGGTINFLMSLFRLLMHQTAGQGLSPGLFAPFRRVLVQDSTCITLPKCYESLYPGSDNQHGTNAVMKLQLIMDMISGHIAELSIASYRRNDQAATGDIFSVARDGDLVLRDLGYFCYDSFRKMTEQNIFFISRLCGQVPVIDPESSVSVELSKTLAQTDGIFDRVMLLGKKQKIPVRVVTIPVPESVVQARRRKAFRGKDRRHTPQEERLRLMSWNIVITNIPDTLLSSEQVVEAYYFRWRIEIIFKAWKSMLKLEKLNFRSVRMLHISILQKLLLCVFCQDAAWAMEIAHGNIQRHVSILRMARIVQDSRPLFLACFLRIPVEKLLAFRLFKHAFYEVRKNRKNFMERIYEKPGNRSDSLG